VTCLRNLTGALNVGDRQFRDDDIETDEWKADEHNMEATNPERNRDGMNNNSSSWSKPKNKGKKRKKGNGNGNGKAKG
jgi:hypothetical protein